jgi:L-threonylcarbamoyladenylate synthase
MQSTMGAAKIVSPDELEACAKRLNEGKLVSFPTETVYGLGCNALDPSAVHLVFLAKERPLTDPLIVHVNEQEQAFDLWKVDEREREILAALCTAFWPGPLTLVARADTTKVPDCIMANTGFVACRSPSHKLARALIKASNLPLAAPSANKFGHVSPTRAQHVYHDLQDEDVWILRDDDSDEANIMTCQVGVESTVAKLEDGVLTVLRQGAVSQSDLQECLQARLSNDNSMCSVLVQSKIHQIVDDTVATVAPGQSIRHYSPRLPSLVVSEACVASSANETNNSSSILESAVVIDFGGRLSAWSSSSMAYRDLSARGDSMDAARIVFDTLRWAEQVDGAKLVLFPVMTVSADSNALFLALKDRLTRAASGVVINTLNDVA